MKQPLLGKKIIQRIESGETTPRIYTIKIILNALGLDYEKIFEKHYSGGKFDKILRLFPNNLKQVLNVSLIAGIVYFLFGWVETASYAIYFLDSSSEINWSDVGKNKFHIYENYSSYGIFIFIKTISVISFSFFM